MKALLKRIDSLKNNIPSCLPSTVLFTKPLHSLIVVVLALATGCGPSTTSKGTTEPAIIDQASTATTTQVGPLNLITKCTESKKENTDFQFRTKVYEDAQGERAQIAHLKFTDFPNDFSQSDEFAIQFWSRPWLAGTWGAWKKRGFWVENANTKKRSPHQYTELTWAQWKQMAAFLGLSSTSASTLLKQVHILVETEDVANRNQILTAKLYMGSASPETTSLVPGHLASPTVLAATGVPEALVNLHPLAAKQGSNLTELQFQSQTQALCF